MDASKLKATAPAPAVQASKPSTAPRQAPKSEKPVASAAAPKNPYDQPRPSVNGLGQSVGTRLSAVA